MHPFLPTLAFVLLGMADLGAWYLWRYGDLAEVAVHRLPLGSVIGVSLCFGVGLAFWLRRFKWNLPFLFAVISVLAVVASAFLRY